LDVFYRFWNKLFNERNHEHLRDPEHLLCGGRWPDIDIGHNNNRGDVPM
jgi:hypothetical protein